MKRFSEILDDLRPIRGSGLDDFGTDKCAMCGVAFDPKDAKYWSRETGKIHFRCFVVWKEKQK